MIPRPTACTLPYEAAVSTAPVAGGDRLDDDLLVSCTRIGSADLHLSRVIVGVVLVF